jgi:PPP family 3-phenylpropionic acid transporter
MALTDTLAVTMAHGGRFDYGRVRLFGSLGFMLVALGTGEAIAGRPADLILWLMLFLLGLACLGAVALPEGGAAEGGTLRPALRAQLSGTMALLKQPGLRWFLLATGLIQNSHVAYYAFGTIYWQKAGIGAATIGWLWAEGVLAEIALFAAAPFITARLGAAQLIMLGGIGGAVRWLALGLSTDLAVLVPMQLLHALSFAAAHLGAMRYLARVAPPGLSATAQGLYGALPLGIGSGIFYVATGILIEHYGGGSAFVAMAASAFAGMAVMSYSDRQSRQNYRYVGNSG